MNIDEVRELIQMWRSLKQKTLLFTGTFDIYRADQVDLIEELRKTYQVERLIIGLNSDDFIAIREGEGRPIWKETERMRVLKKNRDVDAVFVIKTNKKNLAKLLRPDIVVINYNDSNPAKKDDRESELKKLNNNNYGVKFVGYTRPDGEHTNQVIQRIKKLK